MIVQLASSLEIQDKFDYNSVTVSIYIIIVNENSSLVNTSNCFRLHALDVHL